MSKQKHIDIAYFKDKLEVLLRDIHCYRNSSGDLARVLTRLAVTSDEQAAKKEMGIEPVIFEHWDALADWVQILHHSFENHWELLSADQTRVVAINTKEGRFESYLNPNMFPDCPAGTVINRPNGGN